MFFPTTAMDWVRFIWWALRQPPAPPPPARTVPPLAPKVSIEQAEHARLCPECQKRTLQ